jgi:hypothetical protein
MIVPCKFGGPDHEYPDDWEFGGKQGDDPRADARFRTSAYTYFDERLNILWITSTPRCDDEAIDYFTFVASMGKDFNPVWLQATRSDGKAEMLRVLYNKSSDIAYDQV